MTIVVYSAENDSDHFLIRIQGFSQQKGEREAALVSNYFSEKPNDFKEWHLIRFKIEKEKIDELIRFLILRDSLQVQIGNRLMYTENGKEIKYLESGKRGWIFEISEDSRLQLMKDE